MFVKRAYHTLKVFQGVNRIESGIEPRNSLVMHNDRYVLKTSILFKFFVEK